MRVKLATTKPSVPSKPQLHSRKHHHTYNSTRHLPIATLVRYPAVRRQTAGHGSEYALVYEVMLYYERNRACTIYRSLADFARLRKGLMMPLPEIIVNHDTGSSILDLLLRQVLAKRPRECAVEYFLRRRMSDCGGR
ncbi:hypothetical protein B0H63DRAFT_37212 [Podospora didyma]|uniref:PX domain-containing protein n=1 Tax=Podospora didyma TaxID=330526 RepID=A0AAE0P6F0_9PEZI|nr:hypothetical protein B0H63DRAFT_37212 [Podospora didyma]